MPVLNEERDLEAAVAGVLAQDYPGELEVVLAVGPSRDATREIADELAAPTRGSGSSTTPSGGRRTRSTSASRRPGTT